MWRNLGALRELESYEMKLLRALILCLFAGTAGALDLDDFLDRLDTELTVSAFNDNLRARLSGTIDLEMYHFQQPAPGLINSQIDNLFNPRLTLFLDAQLGPRFISLLNRGWIAGSTPVIAAPRFVSTNMRFALRRGMMAVSICKRGRLQPWWAIGSHGIYRGKTHSSTHH